MHYGAEHTHSARADDGWTYRGLKTVVVENETLRAVVLADKGADLYSLVHKPTDTEYLWRTPWGVRDPRTYVPSTGDGTALWADCYEGGWQTVVPGGGYPATYRGADWGLHAEVNLVPWDVVALETGPDEASVTLRVRASRSPVVVTKHVALRADSPTLEVRESVTNVGSEPFDMVYGQHIALGPPFLSGDCVIDLPGGTVHVHDEAYSPNHRLAPGTSAPWPKAAGRDGGTVDLSRIPPRGAGYEDQAYVSDLPDGWYALTNTATGVGLAVRWPVDVFRYLWYWQVFDGGDGYPWWGQTYNVGLEPFTARDNQGIEASLANGSAFRLAPGATVDTEMLATAYRSHDGVANVAADGAVTTRDESGRA